MSPRMQVQTSGQAKIEGRARLLGYSWQPAPPTAEGQVATLTLFLLTLGTLPEHETFDVSLASTEGRLWGKWQTSSQITWQPDAIVEWPDVLSLPVDMPPGSYQLVIRLVDTHVNSEVTRFPLKQPALEIGK